MAEAPTETRSMIQLGAPVPDFEANSTHGPIKLSNYKGQWVLLFSHPADFTPVCTTEFIEFARRYDEFQKRNVKLIGVSIDSVYAHIAWCRNIEQTQGVKIPFPVVADLDQRVSRLYGMVHEPTSVTATVRCVFFIDPNQILRAMIYYPLTTGRNMDEVIRVIDSLQTVDKHGVATPVNWKPGDPVIVPAPQTMELAEKRVTEKPEGVEAKDWYFTTKKL